MGLQINMHVTELKFRRPIFPPLNTYLSNVLVLGPHVAVFESRNLLIKARLKIDKNAVSRGFLSLIARAARPSAAGGGKYVQRWECPMSAYLVPSQPLLLTKHCLHCVRHICPLLSTGNSVGTFLSLYYWEAARLPGSPKSSHCSPAVN